MRAIHQDRAGFIWLGTRAGLCRFDGENYLTFMHEPGNPKSLANHHIRSIHEDRHGTLWLGTFGSGLSSIHPGSRHIENHPLPPNSSAGRIHEIWADAAENLWMATEAGGLVKFLTREKRYEFIRFPASERALFRNLRCLGEGKDGSLWAAGLNGLLFQYFPQKNRYKQIRGIPAATIWEIVQLNDSILALGTIKGLLGLNLRNGKVSTIADINSNPALPNNIILAMHKDSRGKLWIATAGGLAIFHPEIGRTESFHSESMVSHSLQDERLISLMEDRNGLMWIGSWNEGISHTSVDETGFSFVETSPTLLPSVRLENVQKICWARDGQIYASTWQGLAGFNPRNGVLNISYSKKQEDGNPTGQRLWGIYSDARNRLWVGTHFYGLFCREKEGGPLQKADTLLGFSSRLRFSSEITEDKRGRIWVGTFGEGLAMRDEKTKRFTVFRLKTAAGNPLPELNQINIIRCGPDGNLWLGTNGGGLVIFDPESRKYRHIPADLENGGNFNGFVLGIAFTGNTLWLSTEGGGVLYSGITKPGYFSSLNRQVKLQEQNLPAMVTDAAGNLWLGGAGLYRLKTAGRKPEELKEVSCFQSASLMVSQRWQAAALSHQGWLAFGGSRSILFFHPDSIRLPSRPNVILADFDAGWKAQQSDSALEEKKFLRIPAGADFFSLQIANLNFFGQDKSMCFYQLERIHPEPVAAGPTAMVRFTGLQPGLYPFRFRARNEAGIYSPEKIIWLQKEPHWWQTLWFSAICFFLGLIIFMLLLNWRIRLTRRKSEQKAKADREILELELKALRSQMNPHFMFNALNAIDYYMHKNDAAKASGYLGRFARLMRMVLEHSRRERITLSEELECLKLYIQMEKIRLDHDFETDIRIEASLPENQIEMPPMLLQPLAENAILHGIIPGKKSGRLLIQIRQANEDRLLFRVEDNGAGRKQERLSGNQTKKQGLGLSITRERIMGINEGKQDCFNLRDLRDEHGNPCGTCVEFSIPLWVIPGL